jgi:hypothetical protein
VIQYDVTVTTAENVPAGGAAILGIKLAKGQFTAAAAALSNFKIDNAPPTDVVGKLSPDGKVLVITGFTLTADKKVTLFIPKEALEEGDVVVPADVTIKAVGIQGDIDAKESTDVAVAGHNAIKVTLANGFFVSSATAASFTHDPTSKIKTGDTSEVSISSDGKTATIYGIGENTGGSVGTKAKIGIKASALLGYPIVAEADVTVTTAGQEVVTKDISIPTTGDNYITLTLGTGKFVANLLVTAFTIIHPDTGADAIDIGTAGSVKVSADGKKAVIKVQTPSDGTAAFKVNIAASAFSAEIGDPIVLAGDVTATTTQQGDGLSTILNTDLDTDAGNTLIITINNGGKFKPVGDTGLGIDDFTDNTGTVIATDVRLNAETIAIVTLTRDAKVSNIPYSFNINTAAFDESWLVTPDDITVTASANSH